MHNFRRLQVWQRARELTVQLDPLLRRFPRGDHGVLASQLRRAALSIPANISEGCGKSSRKETIRFFQMAYSSATETENHLVIAGDLRYFPVRTREELIGKIQSIQRMLLSLMEKLPP